METVSYVVGVDVCVVPLQSIIQDGDDHSFPCDAFLPHRDHVQVELRQRGRRPRVLLEDKKKVQNDTFKVECARIISEHFTKTGSVSIIMYLKKVRQSEVSQITALTFTEIQYLVVRFSFVNPLLWPLMGKLLPKGDNYRGLSVVQQLCGLI